MIGGVLPPIRVRPFPDGADWQVQLYTSLSGRIKKAADALDAIERGRSDEWITVWKVPLDAEKKPDVSSAAPCSIQADFLGRQHEDVWYYVCVHTEVAGEERDDFVRCRTGEPRAAKSSGCGGSCGACGASCGSRPTEENRRLLQSLDSQTALAQIADQRASASRDDAEKWHSECLVARQTIADLEIEVNKLSAALEEAVANQAPVIEGAVAEKLGGELLNLGNEWLSKPNDKGCAAKMLQANLELMASIQNDVEAKRILLTRHRGPFVRNIETWNLVAADMKLPGKLGVPPTPRLPRSASVSSSSARKLSAKAKEVRGGR